MDTDILLKLSGLCGNILPICATTWWSSCSERELSIGVLAGAYQAHKNSISELYNHILSKTCWNSKFRFLKHHNVWTNTSGITRTTSRSMISRIRYILQPLGRRVRPSVFFTGLLTRFLGMIARRPADTNLNTRTDHQDYASTVEDSTILQ